MRARCEFCQPNVAPPPPPSASEAAVMVKRASMMMKEAKASGQPTVDSGDEEDHDEMAQKAVCINHVQLWR